MPIFIDACFFERFTVDQVSNWLLLVLFIICFYHHFSKLYLLSGFILPFSLFVLIFGSIVIVST